MATGGKLPTDSDEIARKWATETGGTRKATINDVARLAGVSKKTVSRIINKSPLVKAETRTYVEAIIQTIQYVPDPQARGLAFRHSFLVGLIYDNPNPQYMLNIQQGILEGLSGSDYELVVHPCDRSSPDFLSRARAFIERQKLFGVVLTPSVSEDERLADILREIGCGYVRIASVKLDHDERMLVSHDRLGAREAALHLIALGHTRIGFIGGREGFRSSIERREGFEEVIAEAGLVLNPEHCREGDYTFAAGVTEGERLIARPDRPTAIFAANDEMAAGALQALRKAGLHAPDAMSVVGFDDLQIASNVWPRLTTIHSPTVDIGRRAAQRLLGTGEEDATIGAVPWLVERESSGPPPKTG